MTIPTDPSTERGVTRGSTGRCPEGVAMKALLYKVYCYRGADKLIWFELEDRTTGEGVAWSPCKSTAVKKAEKLGYRLNHDNGPVIKFYRAKAS